MRRSEQEQDERGENGKIDRHVRGKTPVLAGVPETAAGDIEPASFRGNRRPDENGDEREQD